MPADERSTPETHKRDPHCERYDWVYYKQLMPYIKGEVLDIGAGAGMFTKEYVKKDEVISVIAIDKYTDELPQDHPKITVGKFDLPDELGVSKESATFDTIVATEFLEHIERNKLEPLLEKVKALLKPKGQFVGSTPNKISPTKNPYHLYEYKLSELASILRKFFKYVEIWDDGENCSLWVAQQWTPKK